jgi:hypothetical protein
MTPWTGAYGRRRLGLGGGLAGEGVIEHLLGEDGTHSQEHIFDLRESCPPGGAVGAIELVDEVFGDALNVRSHFFHLRSRFLWPRHPWLPSQLASMTSTDFTSSVYEPAIPAANNVVRPPWRSLPTGP